MAGKGGILALLAASPKGKGGSKGPPAPMGDMGSGGGSSEGATALREAFDLLKAGDDEGAWTAFKRASAACSEDYEDEGDEEAPMSERGEGEDDMGL
jgi:hypothetical protein